MKISTEHTFCVIQYCCLLILLLFVTSVRAQITTNDNIPNSDPRIILGDVDTKVIPAEAALSPQDTLIFKDNGKVSKKVQRDWNKWRPDAKRAMWLAIVLPGAGQIYNRKYWKLPIVYGGFVGCMYALRWNNQMYHDYSQAYIDLMDNDPHSESYKQFLHLGNQINESNIERYKELFRKRKDRYRRWRDLSVFSIIGVYALSVIDAYVDASLSEFDISDDLSLRIEPTIMQKDAIHRQLLPEGFGIQCRFTF